MVKALAKWDISVVWSVFLESLGSMRKKGVRRQRLWGGHVQWRKSALQFDLVGVACCVVIIMALHLCVKKFYENPGLVHTFNNRDTNQPRHSAAQQGKKAVARQQPR